MGPIMMMMYMQREKGVNMPSSPVLPSNLQDCSRDDKSSLLAVLLRTAHGKAGESCLKRCWDSISLSVKWHGHQENTRKCIHSILRQGWAGRLWPALS